MVAMLPISVADCCPNCDKVDHTNTTVRCQIVEPAVKYPVKGQCAVTAGSTQICLREDNDGGKYKVAETAVDLAHPVDVKKESVVGSHVESVTMLEGPEAIDEDTLPRKQIGERWRRHTDKFKESKARIRATETSWNYDQEVCATEVQTVVEKEVSEVDSEPTSELVHLLSQPLDVGACAQLLFDLDGRSACTADKCD